MDEVRIALEERTDEHEREECEDGKDRLYEMLASLPLDERVKMIEKLARRMGV